MIDILLQIRWQCEGETCSLVYFTFRPDAAAVAMEDALDDGKPNPGAFELAFIV
jgi:hypothetical protein